MFRTTITLRAYRNSLQHIVMRDDTIGSHGSPTARKYTVLTTHNQSGTLYIVASRDINHIDRPFDETPYLNSDWILASWLHSDGPRPCETTSSQTLGIFLIYSSEFASDYLYRD